MSNPKLSKNPLEKKERKELLQVTPEDAADAIAGAKKSLNALIQAGLV